MHAALPDSARALESAGARVIPLVRKPDLTEVKPRAAADPARRRSMALRDQAGAELLLGDVTPTRAGGGPQPLRVACTAKPMPSPAAKLRAAVRKARSSPRGGSAQWSSKRARRPAYCG